LSVIIRIFTDELRRTPDTPKFTKPAIETLIEHCECIAFDMMEIQSQLVLAELKADRFKLAAVRLENDTITKWLELLKLEAELRQNKPA
jgi:hypothetical protein